MQKDFITKLKTKNYSIGSFDIYQNLSKELIKNNSNLADIKADDIMKNIPTTYRASIIDNNGNYIGYIGLYNVIANEERASIRFEVNNNLSDEDKDEILNQYKKWMFESLNLKFIDEERYYSNTKKEISSNFIKPKSNIIIPSKMLEPGISLETITYFSKDYNIPKLQMPFTIKSSDRAIGIIGLTNVIWSNKRGNLNIFLDKNLGEDVINELSGYIIDEYINYIHNSNIHSINLSVSGSDTNMLNVLKDTNMNYYGYIPFGVVTNDKLESKMLFQHIPNMKKDNEIILPNNKVENTSLIKTNKNDLEPIIELNNDYRLVNPKVFEENDIDFNKVLEGHIEAMANREEYTMPLGEDKYILQKGNNNYGLSKSLINCNYVLLDNNNNYAGYINIIRTNPEKTNAEIEIGITPKLQRNGLGTQAINSFYDELFKCGYASVTSSVFAFNTPSLKLHEKVAELNGIRLESYYINGKLWDMYTYTKVNDIIDTNKHK